MKIKICPICVAVSGTWIVLLIARYLGAPVDLTLIAMLMGGSIVGLSYTFAKKLPPGKSEMAWKFISIVSGLLLVYGFLSEQWVLMGFGAAAAAAAGAVFFHRSSTGGLAAPNTAAELKDKMKNCC